MTIPREPRIVTDLGELAEKIRFARSDEKTLGKVVFLIGAGCSISAGIPGVIDITKKRMVGDVAHRLGLCGANADCVVAYKSLVANKSLDSYLKGSPEGDTTEKTIDWYKVYDAMFRRYYTAPDDVRDLFAQLMSDAGGSLNWAHLCLGELVACSYVSTVLTTNFDQLVLSGMVQAGVLPVVCDGIESLNRISGTPGHPQLVELHGSRHTYLLRNAPEDVKAVREDAQAPAAIQKLLQHATTFVAVGYGGREDGVMDLLIQGADVYRDKNLFWVNYSPDPKDISDKVLHFLSTSKNAVLCPGQDADKFFLELCQRLNIGSPRAISQPLKNAASVIKAVSASRVENSDIRAELETAKLRLERLRKFDSRPHKGDPVAATISAIRESRLAGDFAKAYSLAEEALET